MYMLSTEQKGNYMYLPGRLRVKYLLMYLASAIGSLSGRSIRSNSNWWNSDNGPRSGDLDFASFSLLVLSVDPGRVSVIDKSTKLPIK